MDDQLVGTLGQGGLATALIVVFWRVGTAIVEALKGIKTTLDDHTKTDLEHHGKVREAIVALDAKIDTVIDMRNQDDSPSRRAPTEPGAYRVIKGRRE